MPDATSQDQLQQEIAALKTELERSRKSSLVRERELGQALEQAKQRAKANSDLLKDLQSELLSPVYSIMHNTSAMRVSTTQRHRYRLLNANIRAARSIENNIFRLIDLERVYTDSLSFDYSYCSLHSLAHEALLLARSSHPPESRVRFVSEFNCPDYIVDVDRDRVVALLSTTILMIMDQIREGEVVLTVDSSVTNDELSTAWTLSTRYVDSKPSFKDVITLSAEDHSNSSKNALYYQYVHALAKEFEAQLTLREVPQGLIVQHNVKLAHHVGTFGGGDKLREIDQTVVICDDTPPGFEPLPGNVVKKPADHSVEQFLDDTQARLLILHQTQDRNEETLERNLGLCIRSRVPVLLRAADITHEEFSAYREYVDAVLLEPVEPDTLARYVYGLCVHSRREKRRPAQIH